MAGDCPDHDVGGSPEHDVGVGPEHDIGAGPDHDVGGGGDGPDHDVGDGPDHDIGAGVPSRLSLAETVVLASTAALGAALLVSAIRATVPVVSSFDASSYSSPDSPFLDPSKIPTPRFTTIEEPLLASLALSLMAFGLCYALIRWLGPSFVRIGLRGRDLSKPGRPLLPECMGAVCAAVYLLVVIVFVPFPFYKDIVAATSGGGNRDVVLRVEHVQQGRFLHKFPHSKLASYLSAVISLQAIALLGIGDDLLDIRWRHKWWIPGLASVPLLVVYLVDFGVTSIVIPIPLQPYLGELFDLGPAYYFYMACVAMFCPQSINMLAGINGIEVSQSVVVAVLLAINDLLYLATPYPHPATDSHLFSLYLLVPWIGVSLALACHNWYPARVFVGDTYCYFSGMVFAVVGILGHFSKTLGLLLVPQLFNAAYSAPQLFGLVPCPRHRVPRFNPKTGLLEPSVVNWRELRREPHPLVARVLWLMHRLRLLRITADEGDDGRGNETIVETTNLTLLNLWLVWRGPLREDRLALEVTVLQSVAGLFGLFVRHRLALLIFKEDNWGTATM